MAQNLVTQETVEVAYLPVDNARVTQESVEVGYISLTRSKVTQESVEVGYFPSQGARVTQQTLEVGYVEAPTPPINGGGGNGDGGGGGGIGGGGTVSVPTFGTGIITVHGLFPVNSGNQTPYLLIARADKNQVSMLDLYTPTGVKEVMWWSAPIDGGSSEDQKADYRTKKKRFRRMRIYGEGQIPAIGGGEVTFIADRGARVESYPIVPYYSDPTQDILVFQETSPDLVGRQVEVFLSITGTNLVLREMQLEFTVLN